MRGWPVPVYFVHDLLLSYDVRLFFFPIFISLLYASVVVRLAGGAGSPGRHYFSVCVDAAAGRGLCPCCALFAVLRGAGSYFLPSC